MQNFILIANGVFLVKEIIEEAIQGKTIVALDGAVNKLTRLGIVPHVILGDFDSAHEMATHWGIKKTFADLTEEDQAYPGNHGVTIVPSKNQLFTDLTKAIHYCDAQNATSITIICATGGRLDHHESVIRSLRSQYKKNRPIILHTEQQTVMYAKDEQAIFKGEVGDKCGVLAFPKGKMSSLGLEYDVDQFELDFGYSENTSNSLKQPSATVSIEGEALLVMPPQLASQRVFMRLNEIERLQRQLRDAK